jgi:hypothetical protein
MFLAGLAPLAAQGPANPEIGKTQPPLELPGQGPGNLNLPPMFPAPLEQQHPLIIPGSPFAPGNPGYPSGPGLGHLEGPGDFLGRSGYPSGVVGIREVGTYHTIPEKYSPYHVRPAIEPHLAGRLVRNQLLQLCLPFGDPPAPDKTPEGDKGKDKDPEKIKEPIRDK